jgi:hypothetical protein
MDQTAFFLWTGAVIVVAVSIALSVVAARIRLPLLGAAASVPVVLGLLAAALGFAPTAPHPAFVSIICVGLFVLGVTGGGPLTLFVVGLTESPSVRSGTHGGIILFRAPSGAVPASTPSADNNTPVGLGSANDEGTGREVLRGGATIGYLERIAVLGCVVTGQLEGVALVVAIKGLGRFSELDSPEARERFIIGTLISLIWACAVGALLLLVARSESAPTLFGF